MPKTSHWLTAGALAASLGATPSMAQAPQPMPTRNFLQAAESSDQFEITEAQDAVAQSRNPQVRAFAQRMIGDHTADGMALQQAAERSGLPPPTMSLSGDQSKMLGGVQSLRGHDFDVDYARQQVLAHQQALVVAKSYASQGADSNVRQAAQSALPMIRDHLKMAQQLKDAVGGS